MKVSTYMNMWVRTLKYPGNGGHTKFDHFSSRVSMESNLNTNFVFCVCIYQNTRFSLGIPAHDDF